MYVRSIISDIRIVSSGSVNYDIDMRITIASYWYETSVDHYKYVVSYLLLYAYNHSSVQYQ